MTDGLPGSSDDWPFRMEIMASMSRGTPFHVSPGRPEAAP